MASPSVEQGLVAGRFLLFSAWWSGHPFPALPQAGDKACCEVCPSQRRGARWGLNQGLGSLPAAWSTGSRPPA